MTTNAEGNFVHRQVDGHKCSNKSTHGKSHSHYSICKGNKDTQEDGRCSDASDGENYPDRQVNLTFECRDDEITQNIDQKGRQCDPSRQNSKKNYSSKKQLKPQDDFITNGQIHSTNSTGEATVHLTPSSSSNKLSEKKNIVKSPVNNKQGDDSIEVNDLHKCNVSPEQKKGEGRESVRFTLKSGPVSSVTIKKFHFKKKPFVCGKSVDLASHQSLQSEKRAAIMARAKRKTLRMSIAIVATFCICEYKLFYFISSPIRLQKVL